MTSLASYPLTSALSQALMHFVWQGALIGLIAFAIWRRRRLSSHARYLTGIAALAAMLIAPLATTAYLAKTTTPAVTTPTVAPDDLAAAANAPNALRAPAADTPIAPAATPAATQTLVILAVWIAGVIGLSLRLLGGWIVARRLATRAVQPISDELAAISHRIAERLAIGRVFSVLESSAVSVPVMVGWLRPVVLIPTAVLAGLTPVQIEALLAHELAHVRRHDYLVNLLQAVVETLLFYHPAVWWVSSGVRAEREHCCDDLVVSVCDRLTYATALTDLAAMTTPRMALAATDGSLLDRVRRILGQPDDSGRAPGGWAPAVLMVLAVGALVPGAVGSPGLNAERAGLAVGVPIGEQRGVASGVPTGDAAGVPGGIDAGVQGGAAAGVPGGVASGVPAGVPGGAGNVVAADELQSLEQERRQTATTAAELEELKALLARLTERQQKPEREIEAQRVYELLKAEYAAREDWLVRQRRLEQERARLKFDQLEGSQAGRQKELEIELEALRKQIEYNRQRFEVGAVPKDVLERNEAEYQALLAQMAAAQRDRTVAKQQFDLESRAAQERAEYEMRQLQIERAKQELLAKEMGYQALRDKVRGATEEDARAQAERNAELMRQIERVMRDYSTVVENAEALVDQSREIRGGDVLRIEIQNEPGLPTRFEVAADGTIRIPFLGTMKVAGRTPAQIQEQLGRALTDRKLVERAEVAVRIVR